MIQKTAPRRRRPAAAVLIGAAAVGAADACRWRCRSRPRAHDVGLLALLGVAQLAIPCLIAVAAARCLSAPEAALLSLLEIVFGVDLDLARRRRGAEPACARRRRAGDRRAGGQRGARAASAPRLTRERRCREPPTARLGRAPLPAALRRYHDRSPPPPSAMPHAATTRSSRAAPIATTVRAPGRLAACCSRAGRRSSIFSLLAALPWLRRLPRGDGHPVMVFPGLGANDLTTVPLRRFLRQPRLRHPGLGPGLQLRAAPRRARAVAPTTSARSPTARPAGQPDRLEPGRPLRARDGQGACPSARAASITLGTPFTGHPKATNAWRIYELLSGQPGRRRRADGARCASRRRCRRPRSTRAATASSRGAAA